MSVFLILSILSQNKVLADALAIKGQPARGIFYRLLRYRSNPCGVCESVAVAAGARFGAGGGNIWIQSIAAGSVDEVG